MSAIKETIPLRIDRNFEAPSVPLVLTKILQVLDDDRASAKELEQLILHDPSLSARLLRLANSAFYSFRSDVKTLSHAMALLGLNLVKSLAIGVNIFESFTRGMKKEAGQINKLWMHSFGAAVIAQDIWTRRAGRKEGEFAFLCGLLHDLGKIVFFKCDPVNYSKMYSKEKKEEEPDISTLEDEAYGMDHAASGSMLAKHWGLPAELALVIRQHHLATSDGTPLAAVIGICDQVVRRAKIGYDGDCERPAELPNLMAMLNMATEEFDHLVALAESKRSGVDEFFL